MISVIISTYRPAYLNALRENLNKTIGVPYEIIALENKGQMGICEAYNKGAEQARYDILCYSHEDIEIETQDWGNKLLQHFSDAKVGLVGVAGSKYKNYMPSSWTFPYAPLELNCTNYIEKKPGDKKPVYHAYSNPSNTNASEVVAVDGFWFCTRKDIVKSNYFDQTTFKNFHCYDIDFSLQVKQTYKVIVAFDILISHFSQGNFDRTWVTDTIKLHRKWDKMLPINVSRVDRQLLHSYEYGASTYFLSKLVFFQVPRTVLFKHLTKDIAKSVKVLGMKNFVKLNIKVALSLLKRV